MKINKKKNLGNNWEKVRKLFSRIKVSKERFWKILDLMMVLILGSLTYFFAVEAWSNYRLGRTNMSTDEVSIERQPTMIICLGNPKQPDRRFKLDDLGVELHYHIVQHSQRFGDKFTSVKLKEGLNYYKDEIIELNKMKYCYEITTKPVQNYEHESKLYRAIKLIFPKFSDVAYEELNMTYTDLFFENSFHIFFTSQEYSYPIEFGLQTLREETYEAKMRKNSELEVLEFMVWARLKSKMTKYIQEKTNCRNVPLTDLVMPKFISSVKEICGGDTCVPRGFPNTGLRKCETLEELDCSYAVLRNSFVSLQKDAKINPTPCNDQSYTGAYVTDILQTSSFSEEFLYKHNYNENKSHFLVYYSFDVPETTTLIEEYYTVPLFDLIGLVGGTLGMFIGFSFYGTLSDIISLTVSLLLKTGKLHYFSGMFENSLNILSSLQEELHHHHFQHTSKWSWKSLTGLRF